MKAAEWGMNNLVEENNLDVICFLLVTGTMSYAEMEKERAAIVAKYCLVSTTFFRFWPFDICSADLFAYIAFGYRSLTAETSTYACL